MSRAPRLLSESGIYHITLRSVNQQILFLENADFYTFIRILKITKKKSEFQLFAYCLMDNHIHMLLKVKKENISMIVQRITNTFVPWYNEKYDRTGHLLQGRFHSDPIETESHFFNAVRYIMQNPVRAGITSSIEDYRWSSCGAYLGKRDFLTDTEMVEERFSNRKDLYCFLSFPITRDRTGFFDPSKKYTDQEAMEVMSMVGGCTSPGEFQKMDRKKRNEIILKLRKQNVPVGQISRITGVSTRTISRIGT